MRIQQPCGGYFMEREKLLSVISGVGENRPSPILNLEFDFNWEARRRPHPDWNRYADSWNNTFIALNYLYGQLN